MIGDILPPEVVAEEAFSNVTIADVPGDHFLDNDRSRR
jgi:hypothetical protein